MSSKASSWAGFFDASAPRYLEESFTRDTLREVDFIIRELKLKPGQKILDVGCGVGRHSLELTRRGFNVTGLDFSEGMLTEARRSAQEEHLAVRFVHADATCFDLHEEFDAAICLCEGAFGLLSIDEEPHRRDLKILRNIAASLSPGAPFLLTALNGLRMARKYSQEDVRSGRFDPYTFSERNALQDYIPGSEAGVAVVEKGFSAGELRLLLEIAGFEVDHLCGGTAGQWDTTRPLDLDEIEIMVLSHKR
jgi:cyclopropane fatty-acyl-phospholipid synthase-like methyltransferase